MNVEARQISLVYFNNVKRNIEDVCIPMFVIFVKVYIMLHCLHSVYRYILIFTCPSGNVFYSISIFLYCFFHTKIKTYISTLLLLILTITKMFLNVPPVVSFSWEKTKMV